MLDRILITNDDGIEAPGLAVLERIAAELAHEVWVVAPEHDQSGVSHAVSLHHPVRVSERGIRTRARPAASLSIIGRTKLAVFPVPVCAQPRTSRPRWTWGIACSWIGVGIV